MPLTNTILVVEHEAAISELIVELLTDEGYHTRVSSTGREGLAAIAFDPPALTLFDMVLPDLRAEELIDQLHVMELQDMPLVLMSTRLQSAAPLLVPGHIEYLAKPFDLAAILTLVARFVQPQSIQQADERLILTTCA